jgi:mannosyltransferase
MSRLLLPILILLLATGLRFHQLDAQSFWNDEGNSARLSERSLDLIIEGTASDIHPPLYYLLLRGWRELVGESEFGLRSLSAFAGVLTVAGVMGLGAVFSSQYSVVSKQYSVVMVAGVVTAVSPPLIYYSQEARMYSLLAMWTVLSTLVLVGILVGTRSCAEDRRLVLSAAEVGARRKAFSLFLSAKLRDFSVNLRVPVYVLLAAAGLYTQYFFIPVLVFHNLLVLFWFIQRPDRFRAISDCQPVRSALAQWVGIMTAVFILYLPWLPTFIRHTGRSGAGVGEPVGFFQDVLLWLPFGETIEATAVPWPLLAVWIMAGLGLIGFWRWGSRAWLGLLLPPLFMWATGATQSEFHKFMVVSVPFLALLAGFSFHWWPRLKPLPALLLLIALFGMGQSLLNLYTNPAYARADYRGLVAQIAAENHPNAAIILNAPNQWEVFTYYHDEADAPVYPLPRGFPDRAQLEPELEQIADRYDRLYVLFWGDAQQDPERLVERWLDRHAFKAREEWVQDVRFVTYAVPPHGTTEMETAVFTPFGPHITLLGYTVGSETAVPGDILPITLFWETAEPLDTRYKVFIHLVDDGGPPLAQRDSEPGGGLALTTTWTPGEVVVDNHGLFLPHDLPPSDYRLLLGLYDLADPTVRLPVLVAGETADMFLLTTITIR